MARIAAGAGVRQATLYAHFESREAILRAALDAVYEKINASQETAGTENTLERLREMCDRHLDLWADQGEGHHAHLLLEFIAGAPGEDLRETLAARHLESVQRFARVVDEGQREGKIPAGVDPEQVAWMIIGWAFAGDVCHLMGFRPFYDPKIASHWLDVIFASFARATGRTARATRRSASPGRAPTLSKIPQTLEGAVTPSDEACRRRASTVEQATARLTVSTPLDYYLRSHFGKAAARRSRGRRKALGDATRRPRSRS